MSKTKAIKRKPQTPREWALYRVQCSCKIGCEALDQAQKCPPRTTTVEYALYNLLQAVNDLAQAMVEKE